jgi:hypothetical protein
MGERRTRGALRLIRRPGAAAEELPFGSLQELLDLCARHEGGAAFVRVELRGDADERPRRLVLDFGQFSVWPE